MCILPYTTCPTCLVATTTSAPIPCALRKKLGDLPTKKCPNLNVRDNGRQHPCPKHHDVDYSSGEGLTSKIVEEREEVQEGEVLTTERWYEIGERQMEVAEGALFQSSRPWPRKEERREREVQAEVRKKGRGLKFWKR